MVRGVADLRFWLLLGQLALAQQQYGNTTGAGSGPQGAVFLAANENPVNQTRNTFRGFDYSADVSNASASLSSSDDWTWLTTLGLVNLESNASITSLSEAGSSNVLNLVQGLEFPGDELPQQNDTDWTLCASVGLFILPANVSQKAEAEQGDCMATLGANCLAEYQSAWLRAETDSQSNCPNLRDVDIRDVAACDGINVGTLTRSISLGSIQSWLNTPGDIHGPTHGLCSGQGFEFESTENFNAEAATAYYNEFASYFQILLLNFRPKANVTVSLSGLSSGDTRAMCTILNKNVLKQSKQQQMQNTATSLKKGLSLGWWVGAVVNLLAVYAV